MLIERHRPGGECTWTGCIPSKALIQIAKDLHTARQFGHVDIDSRDVLRQVRELVERAHQAEAIPVLEAAGIVFMQGTARFETSTTLNIDGVIIEAGNVVIATGSSPVQPVIPGLETVAPLTNENFFELECLPKRLIILGAGAIGVELAQAVQRLGTQVQLVESAPSILAREEREFADAVQNRLIAEGVQIQCSSTAIGFCNDGAEVVMTLATLQGRQELRADAVLLALGRQPNVHTLNLGDVGIAFDTKKGITIDAFCRTSAANVYAIGDVAGPYFFSHTAGHQARSLVRNLYATTAYPIVLDGIAWCTFTEPELARGGLTEVEARTLRANEVAIFTANYADLDRAVVDGKTCGMIKVVCDLQGLILGATIFGERACELLTELQILKQHGIPLQKLQEAIHPYPAYSELLLSLSLDALQRLDR